jgi:hypothetical protein
VVASPAVADLYVMLGQNGSMANSFSTGTKWSTVGAALTNRAALGMLRQRARQTILDHYSLDECVPRQLDLLSRIVSGLARAA